jgi:hypothetical protein
MAQNIMKLRKRARELGIKGDILTSGSREELEKAISRADSNSSGKASAVKKKRPTAAAKSKPKAAAKKKATTASASSNGDVGRATIGRIDYTVESDAWNPREGSPVDRIFRALKKRRDNVEKVFTDLRGDVKELVSSKKPDGSRRTKAEMEGMLKYRINRTRFEFATRTGQHQRGTKRVKYGEGDYAQASKKAARKAKRQAKAKK